LKVEWVTEFTGFNLSNGHLPGTGVVGLNVRLKELFREVRTSFEERGANTLFLALGFLQWLQKDGTRDCLAAGPAYPSRVLD
jgi:hypothetical protein